MCVCERKIDREREGGGGYLPLLFLVSLLKVDIVIVFSVYKGSDQSAMSLLAVDSK